MGGVSRMQGEFPFLQDGSSLSVVNGGWGEHAQSRVVMLVVVPGKELDAERSAPVVGKEAFWELGSVLAGFELAFRERVVIGDVGPALRFDDPQGGEQLGHGLGFHGRAAVGVDG
jgi:hypothetical protein